MPYITITADEVEDERATGPKEKSQFDWLQEQGISGDVAEWLLVLEERVKRLEERAGK